MASENSSPTSFSSNGSVLSQPSPSEIGKEVSAPVCTAVLTILKVKPGVERYHVVRQMNEEMRVTAKLYLEGRVQQWYSTGDGRGAVFIFSCASVEEAQELTDLLPLVKAGLVNLEFTPLGPLMPLWSLLNETRSS